MGGPIYGSIDGLIYGSIDGIIYGSIDGIIYGSSDGFITILLGLQSPLPGRTIFRNLILQPPGWSSQRVSGPPPPRPRGGRGGTFVRRDSATPPS